MSCDRYLHLHTCYYVREMRIHALSQHLDSYSSLSLDSMAASFGVTPAFLDAELSRFIANGRLACKMDKVSGIIETTRPDNLNFQYQVSSFQCVIFFQSFVDYYYDFVISSQLVDEFSRIDKVTKLITSSTDS